MTTKSYSSSMSLQSIERLKPKPVSESDNWQLDYLESSNEHADSLWTVYLKLFQETQITLQERYAPTRWLLPTASIDALWWKPMGKGQVWCICSVKAVWSTPERFSGEFLTMGRYTNVSFLPALQQMLHIVPNQNKRLNPYLEHC